MVILTNNSLVTLSAFGSEYCCSIGRGGIIKQKSEGDGATPMGTFPFRELFYRPDRISQNEIITQLPVTSLTPDMGWCDDVHSSYYNQKVQLPFTERHEKLWRDDSIYDLIVVMGYNDQPVIKGLGSAIFLHIAREDYKPTEGCVAVSKTDLLHLIKFLGPKSQINISTKKIAITPNIE